MMSLREGSHLEVARVSVFEEMLKVAGTSEGVDGSDAPSAAADIKALSAKDIEEIRTLRNPPFILRRTLEATWLLLNANKAAGHLGPPTWSRVQKMLADASFLVRMQHYDVDQLRNTPAVASYVAVEYFGANAGNQQSPSKTCSPLNTAYVRRKSTLIEAGRRTFGTFHDIGSQRKSFLIEEPLTYQRVYRASHAAAALFKWCTTAVIEVLDPEPEKGTTETVMKSESEVLGTSVEESLSSRGSEIDSSEQSVASALPALATRAAASIAAASTSMATVEPLVPLVYEQFTSESLDSRPMASYTPSPQAHNPPRHIKVSPTSQTMSAKAPERTGVLLTASTPPDRHFELLVEFDLGNAALPPLAEVSLQTVAATICMRHNLRLELQACPDRIEHDALSKTRVLSLQEWFASQRILASINCEERFASSGNEPGVVCSILLDRDRPLREYFIIRDSGQDEEEGRQFGRDVIRDANYLEEDFKTCRH